MEPKFLHHLRGHNPAWIVFGVFCAIDAYIFPVAIRALNHLK